MKRLKYLFNLRHIRELIGKRRRSTFGSFFATFLGLIVSFISLSVSSFSVEAARPISGATSPNVGSGANIGANANANANADSATHAEMVLNGPFSPPLTESLLHTHSHGEHAHHGFLHHIHSQGENSHHTHDDGQSELGNSSWEDSSEYSSGHSSKYSSEHSVENEDQIGNADQDGLAEAEARNSRAHLLNTIEIWVHSVEQADAAREARIVEPKMAIIAAQDYARAIREYQSGDRARSDAKVARKYHEFCAAVLGKDSLVKAANAHWQTLQLAADYDHERERAAKRKGEGKVKRQDMGKIRSKDKTTEGAEKAEEADEGQERAAISYLGVVTYADLAEAYMQKVHEAFHQVPKDHEKYTHYESLVKAADAFAGLASTHALAFDQQDAGEIQNTHSQLVRAHENLLKAYSSLANPGFLTDPKFSAHSGSSVSPTLSVTSGSSLSSGVAPSLESKTAKAKTVRFKLAESKTAESKTAESQSNSRSTQGSSLQRQSNRAAIHTSTVESPVEQARRHLARVRQERILWENRLGGHVGTQMDQRMDAQVGAQRSRRAEIEARIDQIIADAKAHADTRRRVKPDVLLKKLEATGAAIKADLQEAEAAALMKANQARQSEQSAKQVLAAVLLDSLESKLKNVEADLARVGAAAHIIRQEMNHNGNSSRVDFLKASLNQAEKEAESLKVLRARVTEEIQVGVEEIKALLKDCPITNVKGPGQKLQERINGLETRSGQVELKIAAATDEVRGLLDDLAKLHQAALHLQAVFRGERARRWVRNYREADAQLKGIHDEVAAMKGHIQAHGSFPVAPREIPTVRPGSKQVRSRINRPTAR